MWEGNCDSSAIITFELLSTTRFFRGKAPVGAILLPACRGWG